MKKPLILFAAGDTAPATFCLNITYLPKKQSVKMTGFLSPVSDFVNIQKVLDKQHNSLKINSSRLLVLYDSQLVPLHSTPNVCAENSKEDPDLMLCTQLSSLRYGVESSGDHQTVFTGCMEVTVLVRKRWPVLRYPKVCFRAHRGAAGDVDQAEARADKQETTSTVYPVAIQNRASNESVISEGSQTAVGRTPNAESNPVTEVKVHEPVLFNIAHPVVP
ncbi:hypothetical protein FGIG_02302 [Fasciola gigantica]|uniref:Uncharacterized protein n=1 Tax=Fasciola gigantica TaxID=46835 RepID=A0A504YIA5_FASGI|nr:hypothetical protein FGIG_02302 [Fasciola gigantica]